MAKFQNDYEEKKQEFNNRTIDVEYMSEGPAREEAERLLQILKEEMQKYQVQAEVFKKQNEEYSEILAEKEERQVELLAEEREMLDNRYELTLEEYAEVRVEYGEALYEFQFWQSDTASVEFEEAKETLWAIEDTLNEMKWDINDMLNQRTEQAAADYELRVRTQRDQAT
jgi:hypothetical protein